VKPTVDRRFLQNAVDTVARLGINAEAACSREHLAWPLAGTGERIDLALVAPLYELITREAGDPAWLYRAVNEASIAGAGTLFQLLVCCETLFDAFRLGCRYSSVATDVCAFSFHERGHHVDLIISPNPDVRVSLEQVEVAVFVPSRYQRLAIAPASPLLVEAWFRHPPRFEAAAYERHFGCPVRFNAPHNGLRLSRGALDTPLPGGNAQRQAYFSSIAERYECEALATGSLVERVQLLFMQRMAFGEPSVDDIASLLAMSRRTLQRRLLEESSNWRDATDAVRLRVAGRELANAARPLHEVALLTGYADTRAFLRAFRRWTGLTPTQYRDTLAP
jgi:AraC-like DNA-binding protein